MVHAGAVLVNLGATALKLGRPAEAVEHFTRARAAQEASGHDRGRGAALLGLAETHPHLGRLKDVDALLDVVAPLVRRVQVGHETAWYLEVRARLIALRGDLDHAAELLDQAVEAGKGHHAVAVDTRNTLAGVQCLRSRFDEAESWHRRALTAADSSHYRQGRIDALLGLAAVHHHRGDPTRAVEDAGAALDLAVRTGHRHQQGRAHATSRRPTCAGATTGPAPTTPSGPGPPTAGRGTSWVRRRPCCCWAKRPGTTGRRAARRHLRRAEQLLAAIGLPRAGLAGAWEVRPRA
ncbi:tetratricopeptide repeat protein [Saccharothrix sp. BKS2]|uniref:tetratricopeptide repeat protein n=1 Tax=Saccharothrix sp. BKS2 TaxID=3064400 RepID=UPI0039EABC60